MDEELLSKLHRIIDELPDEGSRIDYKDIPYLDTQKAEFIRDLCAFLNCDESYGEEKYIIFGIRNNKEIVGLNSVQMQDDNYYQQLADFIFPRPSIKTGTFIHNVNEIDYCFGYINILGTNNDRIYEINRDKNFSKNNTEINEKLIVRAHTAWIRMGSTKKQLTEYQRRKIYEKDFNTKTVNSFPHVNFTNFDSLVINDKVLKAVFLFGEWDENNENDKFIISEYIGQPYEEWIPVVRIFAKENNEIIEYKNGIWKVKDKFNSLKNYASNYYKEDLLKFGEIVNRILSDRNTKFDLNADQRSMASIYKKGTLYSKTLRKSVAEALVLISANTISFVNCKNEANNLSFIVVRKILSTSDWEIWASLDHLLPLLAEAAPEEYLSQLHNKLISEPEVIQSLFTEHENDIISNNYSTGLIWSLELMAWENRNLIISCMLLLKLAMFDSKVIENIAKIILPWYPQTKAPIENRILVVKTILKENPSMGWKLLMLLMPGKIKSASPTYQPIWINRVDDKTTVNNSEYWKEIDAYVDIAISNAKTNTRKLCDLENVIDDVPKTIFNKIFDKLSSSEITKLNDTRKYIIWDHLMDMITWHKRSKNSKLPHEALQQLEILADKITPNNKLVLAKRYFKKNTWDLIENRKDGKNQLEEKQMQLSNEIYTIGIDTMIDFINNIEDSRHFGACLAQNDMNKIKEAEILNF